MISVSNSCLRVFFGLVGVVALAAIIGCGGSTTGSGGVTVDGRLLSSSNQPLAGVVVTDLVTGDADVSDASGTFSLEAERAPSINLLFEGQGLRTEAQVVGIPEGARRVSALFRANVQRNEVSVEEVEAEESSSSSSSRSTQGSNSSQSFSESEESGASSQSDETGSDSSVSSSESEDDGEGSSSSSAASGDDSGDGSASTSSTSSAEVEREGQIESLAGNLVRVEGVNFVPQSDTEYRDADGQQTDLAHFAIGDLVEAKGTQVGGEVRLDRLRLRD